MQKSFVMLSSLFNNKVHGLYLNHKILFRLLTNCQIITPSLLASNCLVWCDKHRLPSNEVTPILLSSFSPKGKQNDGEQFMLL